MWALDSDAISHASRGEGGVQQRLVATAPSSLAVPALVVYEVSFGLRRAGRRSQLDAFGAWVASIRVLEFDLVAADHAARIRLELESQGLPIGKNDLLIAATARRHGCTLVTHNTREFGRVPGLLIEDWY